MYNFVMLKNISVIAFDIDGTLYPSFSLFIRIIPYFIKNIKFYLKYNKVRKVLHKTAPLPDFFEYQARLLASELKCSPEEAKVKIQSIVYDGIKPYFNKIKPFKGMQDAIKELKTAGYKIAILSDFPPEQKGELWGILPICDYVGGTEAIGALKPSKYPFGVMAKKMGVNEKEILYVGNSVHYDVYGSKSAGMMAAYILPLWRKLFHIPLKAADINFSNYRQLVNIVLK